MLKIYGVPLYEWLIYVTLLFLPFNDMPFHTGLGELETELYVYPLSLALALFPWHKQKFKIKFALAVLGIFYLWTIIGLIINIPDIIPLSFKGKSGLERFLTQLFVLSYELLAFFMFYIYFSNDTNGEGFNKCLRYIIAGFYLNVLVGFIDFLYLIVGGNELTLIYHYINSVFHQIELGDLEAHYGRVRGLTFEASPFAMMVMFGLPFAVRGFFSEKIKVKIIVLLTICTSILLVLSSFSRTGLIILFQMLLIGLYIVVKARFKKKLYILVIGIVCIASTVVSANTFMQQQYGQESFFETVLSLGDIVNSVSNISRFSMQIAALSMGLEHPIFGVGLGQFGFYFQQFLPSFAWLSPEVIAWADPGIETWPPVFSLFPRLVAETGLIGSILFGTFLLGCVVNFWCHRDENSKIQYLAIISFLGVLAGTLNMDSFRILNLWFIVAYMLSLNRGNKQAGT